ncbi:nucleotide exchange factor GrpE [Lactobacillus terrae]|uniref:nucleotide exchange factor GrpE n=1 Tax=Lactobacillus terrae TaxID=2269374 RepID=UPI000C1B685D|nr:nucleotide exchange factor GrpE [Lactobacillus terrae]
MADKENKIESTDEELELDVESDDSVKNDETNEEIEALKEEKSELEDKYLRAQAEMQNMTARHQKEVASILKYDGQNLATEILPVLDNLERALTVEADDEASAQLKKGIEMVQTHLINAFKDNQVIEINNKNEKFDPTVNQAVQTVPATEDNPADTVVEVLQKGYMLNDRVLRPAMVVVAK